MEMKLPELPNGINETAGMCGMEHRSAYQRYPAPAYSINEGAMITISTNEVFVDGFPSDFSIMAVLKAKKHFERVPVFSIFTSESEEALVLMVGSEVVMFYQDTEGNPREDGIINFGVSTNDLKWHRIAISVKGDSVTLIFDCTKQITKQLQRRPGSKIEVDGLILTGVQLDETEEYFTV